MKLSNSTINALGRLITGDSELTPYLSGPKLVSFFNDFGSQEVYASGFPSRWKFAEQELLKFNNTDKLSEIIVATVDPRRFLNSELNVEATVEFLNKYLQYDNYELVKNGLVYKVVVISKDSMLDKAHNSQNYADIFTNKISNDFIVEQSEKCHEKIDKQDYDGAITNARSMIEGVLVESIRQNINEEYKIAFSIYYRIPSFR